MSEFYQEQIARMVRNKFADNIMQCLRDCDPMMISSKTPSVRVPLVAGADCVFDSSFGDIVLTAEIKVAGENLGGSAVYSTKEITSNADAANIIHHICEELKKSMLHALAKKEFERVLKETVKP